jgi:hypothetical protein
MIEHGEHFGFALKRGEAICLEGHRGREHLDRHRPLQIAVGRAIHLAHAACAEGSHDLVWAELRSGREAPSHLTRRRPSTRPGTTLSASKDRGACGNLRGNVVGTEAGAGWKTHWVAESYTPSDRLLRREVVGLAELAPTMPLMTADGSGSGTATRTAPSLRRADARPQDGKRAPPRTPSGSPQGGPSRTGRWSCLARGVEPAVAADGRHRLR